MTTVYASTQSEHSPIPSEPPASSPLVGRVSHLNWLYCYTSMTPRDCVTANTQFSALVLGKQVASRLGGTDRFGGGGGEGGGLARIGWGLGSRERENGSGIWERWCCIKRLISVVLVYLYSNTRYTAIPMTFNHG